MKTLFLASVLISTQALAQTPIDTRSAELELNGEWLRGYKHGARNSIEIAPSASAFNQLVGRVATLEERAGKTEGRVENGTTSLKNSIDLETTNRTRDLADLREELCKSVGKMQAEICKDQIFIEAIQEIISKAVKEEVAKVLETIKASKEQGTKEPGK